MNPHFQRLMRDATRLTQGGDLMAATAAIQAALSGTGAPTTAAPSHDEGVIDDVIDVDARVVGDAARPVPASQPAQPAGDRFISGSFAGASMQRAYKLYIPPAAGDRPLPLVVMLHGCTQDPDDFAAGTAMNALARAQGFYVLYPAQSQQANPQRCWNWFKHSHQQRGRGEPALLAGMTQAVMAQHAIDADRVYVAGLSAGGAMAAILAGAYPELYAAAGVHSGLAAGSASDLPSALAAMRQGGPLRTAGGQGVPTIVFHGDGDTTVHPANGEQVAAASAGADAAAEVTQATAP
ncbi:MAG: PHB depolymerase family esterase, partial [Comamonadaceae bacterium]